MSDFIAQLLAHVSANVFSDIFIVSISLIFLLALFCAVIKKGKSFVELAPNMMTSLGILGTFIGIMIGLMEFDPKQIDDSISLLLEGLKTAFLTSLVGMFGTIAFKLISSFLPKSEQIQSGVGPDDIYAVMQKQLDEVKSLVASIKGDEDASLTSQLRLLRADLNDGNKVIKSELESTNLHTGKINDAMVALREDHKIFSDRLWLKMDEFSDVLSKSATEQVINALKEVIVEFNDKLTEQFGENFKRLDESVKKLVDWQDNYRHQLEDMAKKYQLGVDAIGATEQSVQHISEKAASIPEHMAKLESVMASNESQIRDLEDRLEAFKTLRDKAIEAMPEIKAQLDSTMSTISDSVTAASHHYENMLHDAQQMMTDFTQAQREANDEYIETSKEQMGLMREGISTSVTQFTNTMMTTATNLNQEITAGTTQISKDLAQTSSEISETSNQVKIQSEQIREQLDHTVTDIHSQVQSLIKKIKEQSSDTAEILIKSNQELQKNTEKSQQVVVESIHELQNRLKNSLEEIFQAQVIEVERTFKSLEQQTVKSLSQTGSAIEEANDILDKQMQEEIQRVVQEMGQDLATVTQQFTRDYTHLTDEMKKVVHAANRVM